MKPRRTKPFGPAGLEGSDLARRHAAIVLESLSGASGPLEASRAMGVALARYYQLEARALQAVVKALEPRPRGRRESEARTRAKAEAGQRRQERELHRYQALYRAAQKTLGISPAGPTAAETKGKKQRRRMRRVTRGERVAQALRSVAPSAAVTPVAPEGSV